MGFLGMSGKTWKRIGKIALKAAPIVAAPFTGGASLLALGAGTGALSGMMDGGGWKGALMGGGLGAIPGGGAGGAAAGGAAKAGLKEIAKGVAKGAATNFATGTATGLATGQGLKGSLQAGGTGALEGLGTSGTGGFKQAAKTVGKNVAMNVGGTYASQGLQAAGVPGGLAAQGGNVFTNYLGNKFTGPTPGGSNFASPQGQQPQAPAGGGSALPNWKSLVGGALTGAAAGSANSALNGGGWRGIANGAVQGATGGSPQPTYPGGSPNGLGSSEPGVGDQSGPYQPAGGSMTYPPQPPGKQPPDPNRPPTWAERYGPLIAQGAGLAVGAVAGQQAQKSAMKRSPEEQAALAGAQGAAGNAGKLGAQLGQQGQDYLQKPGQYFQTLLGGNRAAMSQAVAGPTAQITGNYRGAERALDQAGVRGAGRDQAVTDLNRQRVSQLAGLTTGMQPYAAEQLASMGNNALGQAGGLMSTSGNIYQNLLSQGTNNRTYGRAEGERTASAIGGLARDVGEVAFKRQPAPAVKSTTPQPSGAAPGPAAPAGTPAPPPQAGTPHAPPAPAGPGQLPFGTPGQLGMGDFRPGVRKPQTSLGGDFRTY